MPLAPTILTRDYWLGETDARPLALFRIGLSLTILYDLVDRARDLGAFYTDAGVLPRAVVAARAGRWSLLDLAGTATGVDALFLGGFVAALCLLVGYRTRVASVAVFVVVHSLIERNLLVCDSGDGLVRAMSFWLMFADAGACYAVDARNGARFTVAAFPVRLLQLQVLVVYLFGAASKTGPTWRDGTAIERALSGTEFARPMGALVAASPRLCALLARVTLLVEAAFPFLVLSSNVTARRFALLSGLALHVAIFATMRVGLFSHLMPVTYLVLLEREDVDRVLTARPSIAARDAKSFPHALAILLGLQMSLVLAQQIVRLARHASPTWFSAELEATGTWQRWNLFAPDPPPSRLRWEARTARGDAMPPEMLPDRSAFYRRWQAYRFNLASPEGQRYLPPLGRWLCTSDTPRIDLVLHVTPITTHGRAPAAEDQGVLATVECAGSE